MTETQLAGGSDDTMPAIYSTSAGLKKLANYLRSVNGVKLREGVEHDKRVQYFKGARFVETLIEAKKWPKGLPEIKEKSVAYQIAGEMLKQQFFHRSEKIETKKGFLRVSKKQVFEEEGYYTWMYSGSMVWSNMATFAVIAVVIIFTLLPVWPPIAKKILWWISVTFLLVTFTFLMIRLILFLLCWICGFEFWIFPRLFDETLGVIESFQPPYVFEKGSPGQGYYRIALLLALVGFVGWALSQPTEFDGFIKAQKEFVDDLYSGNLLADVAAHRENLENLERSKRFPKIDQLLREMEEDEKESASAGSDSATGSHSSNDESELSEESRNALDEDRLDALLNDEDEDGGAASRVDGEEGTNEDAEQEL